MSKASTAPRVTVSCSCMRLWLCYWWMPVLQLVGYGVADGSPSLQTVSGLRLCWLQVASRHGSCTVRNIYINVPDWPVVSIESIAPTAEASLFPSSSSSSSRRHVPGGGVGLGVVSVSVSLRVSLLVNSCRYTQKVCPVSHNLPFSSTSAAYSIGFLLCI